MTKLQAWMKNRSLGRQELILLPYMHGFRHKSGDLAFQMFQAIPVVPELSSPPTQHIPDGSLSH